MNGDCKFQRGEMAPLEALALKYPLIDSNFTKFCASHGILNVEDFLLHDLYALAAFAEQDCSSDKLKQGITQVLSILDNQHRPWLNGLELLDDAEQKKYLSTGCERIDVLLQGGLREGHVTELVGPSSSGKTQICLQAASNVAKKYSGMVMYFDSGNSFSPKRMAQFLSQSFDPANSEVKNVNQILERVMSSIVHYSVFDIFTLLDLLHQLLHDSKSQMCCQVRMLIIDSLSSLIAPVLGGGGAHGHALMVSAGFLLKELAHEHNLSVLAHALTCALSLSFSMLSELNADGPVNTNDCCQVTNHMVSGEAGASKPALGESWKNIPHIRLLLSRYNVADACCISILKHPYLDTGRNVEFEIT